MLGKDDLALQRGYIREVKDYQSVKKAVTAGEKSGPCRLTVPIEKPSPIASKKEKLEDMTFEELFKSIKNPAVEIASAEEVKKISTMEKKIEEDNQLLENELPEYFKSIDDCKREIVAGLIERSEMMQYMQQMCNLMKGTNPKMFNEEETDTINQIAQLSKFYDIFAPRIACQLYPEMRIQKRVTVLDYFESVHRSNLLKKKSPNSGKKRADEEEEAVDEDSPSPNRNSDNAQKDSPADRNDAKDSGNSELTLEYFENSPVQVPVVDEAPLNSDEELKPVKLDDSEDEKRKILEEKSEEEEGGNEIRRRKTKPTGARRTKRLPKKTAQNDHETSHSKKYEEARKSVKQQKKQTSDFDDKSRKTSSQSPRPQREPVQDDRDDSEEEDKPRRKKNTKRKRSIKIKPSKSPSEARTYGNTRHGEDDGMRDSEQAQIDTIMKNIEKLTFPTEEPYKSPLRQSLGALHEKTKDPRRKTPELAHRQTIGGEPRAARKTRDERNQSNRQESSPVLGGGKKKTENPECEDVPLEEKSGRATYKASFSKIGGKERRDSELDAEDAHTRGKSTKESKGGEDLPPLVKGLDASRYENLIYQTKKRRMYIAVKDFRSKDKNFFPVRQGDVICCVTTVKGWYFVYKEDNPKKFGFCPGNYLNIIS